MSIGWCKAPLRLSAKLSVRSVYDWITSQVQQLFAIVPVAMILIPLLTLAQPAQAKKLRGGGPLFCRLTMGQAGEFFDWTFAKKVWYEMNTNAAWDAEMAKYAADFTPWFEQEYKKNIPQRRKAVAALESYPPAKRHNIERGYDLLMVKKVWECRYYAFWYGNYGQGRTHPTETYLEEMARYTHPRTCDPQKRLPIPLNSVCGGPIPDWRSPEMKADEQAMIKKRDLARCGGPCPTKKAK